MQISGPIKKTLYSLLFFVLLTFLIPTPALPQTKTLKPNNTWSEFVFEEDDFALRAPVAPNKHPDRQIQQMTAYFVPFTKTSGMTLHVGPLPENCSGVLKQLKDGAVADQRQVLQPDTLKEIAKQNISGFEYDWRSSSVQGYTRWACGPKRVYGFTAFWPVNEPKPPALKKIVESFRILSAPPR
jgi:hypothetical protein